MEDDVREKRKREAAERRRRILEKGSSRLQSIQGNQSDVEINSPPVSQPTTTVENESTPTRDLPPTHAVQQRYLSLLQGLEAMTVVVKSTMKMRIGIIIMLAVVYAMEDTIQTFNPFTLLLITQVLVLFSSWSYLQLYPQTYRKKVEGLRMEMKFKRMSGQDWKPRFLYWIPGFGPVLNNVDYLRICTRGMTESVSVFVVFFVLTRHCIVNLIEFTTN